jgi:hypothetical protein
MNAINTSTITENISGEMKKGEQKRDRRNNHMEIVSILEFGPFSITQTLIKRLDNFDQIQEVGNLYSAALAIGQNISGKNLGLNHLCDRAVRFVSEETRGISN